MYKLENNISIITLVSFLAYISYVFFRLGNQVFYGYPLDLIWIDFNSLVVVLIQNSVIIMVCIVLMGSAYKSSNTFINNVFIVTCGMLSGLFFYNNQSNEQDGVMSFGSTLIMFILVFAINSTIKKAISLQDKTLFSKWNTITFILFCSLSFNIGNYSPNVIRPMTINNKGIVVGSYGNDVITISCNDDGTKEIKILSLTNVAIITATDSPLKRDWFVGKCHSYNKVNLALL